MLDTSVAIHLRDGDPRIGLLVRAANQDLAFSIVTLIELEAGLLDDEADIRRARIASLLETISSRSVDSRDVTAYGRIVQAAGYSRRKVLDRMIAAQAIVDDASLVTMNGADFRDIPNLKLVEW